MTLAIATAACSSEGDAGSGDTPTSVTGTTEPEPEGPQMVTPRPGMLDVTPRPFESWTVAEDDRTLTIEFWSGVVPCHVLDHVDVGYGADEVTVTLFEGHEPLDEGTACIEIGVLKAVRVVLDEPVAGRDVADGAAGDGSAIAPGEVQPVTLYVSNQSFSVDPVDITITLDDEVVVAQDFLVEGQHNWIEFALELAGGEHGIEVRSARGLATYEGVLPVDGPLWVVIDYWGGAESEDGAPMFSVYVSTEPVAFM
jgi:hypothetical protein